MKQARFPDVSIWAASDPPPSEGLEKAAKILGPNQRWAKLKARTREGSLGMRFRRWEIHVLALQYKFAVWMVDQARKAVPWNEKREGPWDGRKALYARVQKHTDGLLEALRALNDHPWEGEYLERHHGWVFGGVAPLMVHLERLSVSAGCEANTHGPRKKDLMTQTIGTPDERLVRDLREMWLETGKPHPIWAGDFKNLVLGVASLVGRHTVSERAARFVLTIPPGVLGPAPLCCDPISIITWYGSDSWRRSADTNHEPEG